MMMMRVVHTAGERISSSLTPSENMIIIRESTGFTKRKRFAAFHEKKTDSSSCPPVSPRRLTPRAS
jgi:hypothetical protein